MRAPTIDASSRSTPTPMRWVMPLECWRASSARRALSGSQADAARFGGPGRGCVRPGQRPPGGRGGRAADAGATRAPAAAAQPLRGMAARLGDWEVAITAAEEARRLAEEFGEPQWAAAADTAMSM